MDKILNEEQLVNHLAWVLHYESWYKESIEGKFGLNSDGTGSDHGRFRKSKDKTLDEEFIKSIQFDENGYSLLKDEHGNPYYKMENGEFYVDSAIKGFDFLPPSWKKENIDASKKIVSIIKTCIDKKHDMGYFLETIGKIIHNAWVARQVASIAGISESQAGILGRLTKEEAVGMEPSGQKHSMLYDYLGGEAIRKIWGVENFVEFEDLTLDEQLKDINQIIYALKMLNKIPNYLFREAQSKGYLLNEQLQNAENAKLSFIENGKDQKQ